MSASKRRNRKRASPLTALFIPVAFLFGLVCGYLLWGSRESSAAASAVSRDDPSLGPRDAPVVIVEFSDYQCPYCKRWHDEVLPLILTEYGDQVRYIYRDYPLNGHPEAQPAAEAANCAGEQEAYWEFHDAIFSEEYGYGRSAYVQYARDLGLDTEAFNECLNSRKFQDEVMGDFRDGIRLGVNSTPTFFVNDTQVIGAQPFEVFQQLIEAELALVSD
jgi:protein-disulfide isomerase